MDIQEEEQVRGSEHRRRVCTEREAPRTLGTSTSFPVPEVVFLLDAEGRIVRTTGPHPGPRLGELSFRTGMNIHDALHPSCSHTDCRLTASLSEAWRTHLSGLPVEWLFFSQALDGVLKLRLQPVGYVCGALFGDAVACYEDCSVLFMHDITVGYRAAERDEHPDWQVLRQMKPTGPLVECLVPARSPALESGPDSRVTGLAARLLVAQEAEQKRLAAEIHDGLGQSLSLLRFEIEGCLEQQKDPERALRTLERASDYVRRSQEELRRITANLRPVALKKYGLTASLDLLCRELRMACPGINVASVLDGLDREVPDELAFAVYRIAQEALNNVASHSQASAVTLEFRTRRGAVELRIADDGVGLPLTVDRNEGLGLTTMRERAEALAGQFSLMSAPGEGCELKVRWKTDAARYWDNSPFSMA